jgi:hypothetical protein
VPIVGKMKANVPTMAMRRASVALVRIIPTRASCSTELLARKAYRVNIPKICNSRLRRKPTVAGKNVAEVTQWANPAGLADGSMNGPRRMVAMTISRPERRKATAPRRMRAGWEDVIRCAPCSSRAYALWDRLVFKELLVPGIFLFYHTVCMIE